VRTILCGSQKLPTNPPIHSQKLKCVDLFAGAGGLSLAAHQAGIDVVAAVEQDHAACETYRHNLMPLVPGLTLYEADILDLSPVEVLSSHFKGSSECDIMLGGPPCQGFSTHRIKDAGVKDPRNALILRYFEYVETLRPKVFLMENVPGILWPRHLDFLDAFYQRGRAACYTLFRPQIIDARDYGVPQRRRRVFVLGIRNDVKFNGQWPPTPTHTEKPDLFQSGELLPWVPASSVFSAASANDDENLLHMKHTPELIKVFASTPINGGSRRDSGRTLPCHIGHNGHKDVYGRINPGLPGPTMTTACINPSKGRFVHPTENHGITVRHAARFQTFPDSYCFKGGLTSAGKQIGNAVPVLLGKVLLESIAAGLRSYIPGGEAGQSGGKRND